MPKLYQRFLLLPFIILALVYLLVALFPDHYAPIGANLDESWVYEINHLTAESAWSGVVFTYGPLGYLLVPRDLGYNLVIAMGFQLLMHLLFAGLIFYYAWQSPSPLAILFFVVGYVLAATLGLNYEYHLLIIFALLSCRKVNSRPWQVGVALLSGGLAALFLLMKFNLGVAAAGMLALVSLSYLASDLVMAAPDTAFLGRLKNSFAPANVIKAIRVGQARYFVVPAAAAYMCTLAGIGLFYLSSPVNFFTWLRYALDIAGQYSVTLSISGPQDIATQALLLLGVFAFTGLWLAGKDANMRMVVMVLGLMIFFAFKGGFVRQDGHELNYFPAVIAALSLLFLFIRVERLLPLTGLSLLVAVGLSLPVVLHYGWLTSAGATAHLLGQRGWGQVQNLLHFNQVRTGLAAQSAANLETLRLPDSWLAQIGDNSVAVLPVSLTLCPANQLNCRPNPLLQPYTGGSQSIDTWNAGHYAGPQAPDYLLVEFFDIDGRHPLWGLPATWQTILQYYRPIELLSERNLLLLQQKPPPSPAAPTPVTQTLIRLNEWVDVPAADQPLLAGLDLRLGWWGQVRKFLFRIPAVTVDVQTVSGEMRTYRLVPDTAKNGLFINFLPKDINAFHQLLQGQFFPTETIARFKISGPGSHYFQPEVPMTWSRLDLPISFPADQTALQLVVGDGSNIEYSNFTVNGDSRPVIYAHPPSEVVYALTLPDESDLALQTSLGLNPAMWDQEPLSDGVTFNIYVEGNGEAVDKLFSQHVDPNHNPDDRAWQPVTVDLSDYAGQAITLRLETTSGPAGDLSHDWAGWAELALEALPQ